jgi:energy-coupling factor transport system permease protein
LFESVQRFRRAPKLRGGASGGFHALRSTAIPVMEDALERSLRLAAAMDSRGYGRIGTATHRSRRVTGVLMLGGMCGLCLGTYGLLGDSTPGVLGLPVLAAAALVCCLGLAVGGRRVGRSQYRPDPWRMPEWVVAVCGLVPAVVLILGVGAGASGLNPSVDPLRWPTLPLVPALAILVGAVAAIAAPPPLRPRHAGRRGAGALPGDRAASIRGEGATTARGDRDGRPVGASA